METSIVQGLTFEEAERRLKQFGLNELPKPKSASLVLVFIRQFKSPFIYVLLAAAGVSFGLGQTVNAWFIFGVLLINAAIGTIQEFSAQQAAAALKKMVPSDATVIRDGKTMSIPTANVVPGDLVQLASGDKVPADIRLNSAQGLYVDESLLTGESKALGKTPQSDDSDSSVPMSICFSGTSVVRGRGLGKVEATGVQTELGKIAEDVMEQQVNPPLLLRIEQFTMRIIYSILILISIIFFVTVIRGDDIATVFLLGVALAVSAIPEGLPAAITVALAIGMRRMAKQNVIIRTLVAVEGLGSCTYIATDKTGTLTVNEMTVKRIVLPDTSEYGVSGEGIDLHGQVDGLVESSDDKNLRLLATAGILANEALLENEEGEWKGHGDNIDVALLVFGRKLAMDHKAIRARYTEASSIPYESENAYCASINRCGSDIYLFVKGSVEKLLTMSRSNTPVDRVEDQTNSLAQKGYRVLGFAYKKLQELPANPEAVLVDLEFLGIAAIIDPLRSDVKEAVKLCKKASIKVAMITGDHPKTAIAIAKEAGIADETTLPITGSELAALEKLKDDSLSACIKNSNVFARISPHQKKQIVDQLILQGEFVAVTGDGANDAPALSNAHIGIAMGLRGTDVARESSDLVLSDDHFSSILQGVKQGRIVYNNIRKVIFLLVSTGAAEIVLVILSLLFGTPLPLLPIQLLWLNLVTNGIQDVALAFEPEEGNELNRPPRPPNEPIFNRLMIERVIANAIVMGGVAFFVFAYQLSQGVSEDSARNITLLLMVLFENIHVLNSRSETCSIFRHPFFGNKFLLFGMLAAQSVHIAALYMPVTSNILQLQPVNLQLWLTLLGVALILVVLDETHKLLRNRRTRNHSA